MRMLYALSGLALPLSAGFPVAQAVLELAMWLRMIVILLPSAGVTSVCRDFLSCRDGIQGLIDFFFKGNCSPNKSLYLITA